MSKTSNSKLKQWKFANDEEPLIGNLKKKSLKIFETTVNHWNNYVTFCINYRCMNWCNKISVAQHNRNSSMAIQPTSAGIPNHRIAFHAVIQGHSLLYLATLAPFQPNSSVSSWQGKEGRNLNTCFFSAHPRIYTHSLHSHSICTNLLLCLEWKESGKFPEKELCKMQGGSMAYWWQFQPNGFRKDNQHCHVQVQLQSY